MARKIIFTILWMVVFATVALFIDGIALFVVDYITSFISPKYVFWTFRLIFFSSPLVALFLGLRGALPGTKPSAVSMRNTSAIPIILALIVAIMGVWLTWVVFHPARHPNVSVTFLDYTNDTNGTRLARIAVTNLNTSAVHIYLPRIEIPAPTEPGGFAYYHSGGGPWWHSELGRGASGNFTIPTPTNQSPWRLLLYAYPDVGAARVIKRVVIYTLLSVGLKPRYQTMPFEIEGDWVEGKK